MTDNNFLEQYLNGFSPSGYEIQLGGQKIWIDYVSKFAYKVDIGSYGNAYAYFGDPDSDVTVLLDAHADEIGYAVSDITKDGFIKVERLGGSDINITPASKATIWTDNGPIIGVFGHPAIHVQERGKFKVELEKMFIDIGAESIEVALEMGLEVGNPITMVGNYSKIGKFHTGRALDDKIGGYINAMVLKTLYEAKVQLPYKLVIVNAVQEEVGIFGAKMALNDIKPDVAFAIDVTHCTKSPAYDSNKLGSVEAGKGVVLMDAPSIQKNLLKLIKDTAKIAEIPFQMAVSGRGTGTNADSYAYPNGVPTALFKMAMRYMHTTSEMVHEDDVNNTIQLILDVLKRKELILPLDYLDKSTLNTFK